MKFLKNFSVKFKITPIDDVYQEKYYHCCLHCGRVMSKSGIFYHRENVSLTDADINRYVTGFFNNMERYKNVIKTQFESRSADGRSFQRSRVQDRRTVPPQIPFTPIPAEPRLLPLSESPEDPKGASSKSILLHKLSLMLMKARN